MKQGHDSVDRLVSPWLRQVDKTQRMRLAVKAKLLGRRGLDDTGDAGDIRYAARLAL